MTTDAKTIREIANKINQDKRQEAVKVVQGEWEHFIAPRIMAAAKDGAYSCSYFWYANTLVEQGVDVEHFQMELKKFIVLLGYNAEITTVSLMGEVTKITIYINWRD
jgi:xylose isomerase